MREGLLGAARKRFGRTPATAFAASQSNMIGFSSLHVVHEGSPIADSPHSGFWPVGRDPLGTLRARGRCPPATACMTLIGLPVGFSSFHVSEIFDSFDSELYEPDDDEKNFGRGER